MFSVELYGRVRHACIVEGLSRREAARRFGIDRKTVAKMLRHAVPPGYRRTKPPPRPRLDGFTPIIDRILEADRAAPPKQRHTAKRIFERLRAEHRFTGGYTIVKDYVREHRARARCRVPSPGRRATASRVLSYRMDRGTPPRKANAASWPSRKASLRSAG